MEIDWITVSAQIVNFLILIWLLKRFLYQRVIDAMQGREERIAQRLQEAEEREEAAEDEAQRFRSRQEELDGKRNEILERARAEAGEERKRLTDEARTEIDETRTEWQRQVEREREEFLANLRQRTAHVVEAIARKALRDLADAELEEHIVHAFIDRLEGLDRSARKSLSDISGPVRVTTAFELDGPIKGRMTRAIHEKLAEGLEVEYADSPDLICGIELKSDGQRLGWSISDYMDELTVRVDEAFSAVPRAGAEA